MGKLRRYTRTMMAILLVYMVIVVGALYFVSGALARETTRTLAAGEAARSVQAAAALLERAGADTGLLREAVNPVINPSDVFLIILDAQGGVLALSDGAAAYADGDALAALTARLREEELTQLPASGNVLWAGLRTEAGTVLAGKTLEASNRAAFSFRALLRTYALSALGLTVVALFLLAWRIMQPVDTLVSAAQRMSDGELVEINEKLPVELRPLGRAFNRMSHRLSRSMGELTYERDTLSRVLESLDEGVLAVDRAGDILRENQAAARLLGGQNTAEYARVLSLLRKTGVQEDLLLQAGERTVLAVFRPLAAGAGALAVLRDVTEHERLERTRREYVANISHELRTPLSSMRGITEGLRDGLVASEEERRRYYELLLGEVKRLSRLVNDLLELSNLQSSPAAFSIEPVDPLETLYELHGRTRTLAREKGVELALEAPETLPEVLTNEDRLQQVLTILLDNAIKFTPAGGTVTLSALQEARYVRFSVRDTGIGMDEYTQRHAFDRFHQADASRGAKGSGLGLAIAREVMQRLGTRIVVRSKPGEGSEFSFLIRVAEEKD